MSLLHFIQIRWINWSSWMHPIMCILEKFLNPAGGSSLNPGTSIFSRYPFYQSWFYYRMTWWFLIKHSVQRIKRIIYPVMKLNVTSIISRKRMPWLHHSIITEKTWVPLDLNRDQNIRSESPNRPSSSGAIKIWLLRHLLRLDVPNILIHSLLKLLKMAHILSRWINLMTSIDTSENSLSLEDFLLKLIY